MRSRNRLYCLRRMIATCVCLTAGVSLPAWAAEPATGKKINMLVVIGGHGGFKEKDFYKLFDDMPNVTYTTMDEKNEPAAWDRDDLLHYNVILLYDFRAS